MNVARLQAKPVHGREPTDGIAALAMPHELWLCGRAGSEIEQDRIVRLGRPIRRETLRKTRRVFVSQPSVLFRGGVDDDANQPLASEARKLDNLILGCHDGPGAPAVEPVARSEERRVGKESRSRWWPAQYREKRGERVGSS